MRLTEISLDGDKKELSNLIVIIGPNSSGKTTLLRELWLCAAFQEDDNQYQLTQERWATHFFDIDSHEINKIDIAEWIDHLRFNETRTSPYGLNYYSPYDAAGTELTKEMYDEVKKTESLSGTKFPNSFLAWKLIKAFTFYHTVDARLELAQNSEIDETQDLMRSSILDNDSKVRGLINQKLQAYFNRKIFILRLARNTISIVIGSPNLTDPSVFSYTGEGMQETHQTGQNWLQEKDAIRLRDEGHGIRSWLDIMVSLADNTRKVLFIDEPELHLYPEMKRRLGRDIANASNENKQVFLVTHDADLLQGLVDNNRDFDVIRLTDEHKIAFIPFGTNEKSKILTAKKNSDALQVGFFSKAIFVEGVDDRYIYEKVADSLNISAESTIFVACDGKDRVASKIAFAAAISMPFCVILDYDVLVPKDGKDDVISNVLEVMHHEYSDDEWLKTIKDINETILVIRAFSKGKENKKKGLKLRENYEKVESEKIETLLTALAQLGIFIVPCGALEDWISEGFPSNPPEELFNSYLQMDAKQQEPLNTFIRQVIEF